MAEKIVVLDSHALNDNRISKHIGSVGVRYPVLRLNFNFYAKRNLCSTDEHDAKVFNVGSLNNPYLNGILFTVRNILGYSRRVERLLRKEFVHDGDGLIFHVHDPYVLGLAQKLKRKFPDSRVVYDRHEYFETWHNRLGFSSPGFLEKLYSECSDEIVFVSRRLDSLPEFLKDRRVSVIPNYPQEGLFTKKMAEKKIADLASSERIEFVYFGVLNLDFDRDMRLMFHLMDSLMASNPTINFTVAGRLDHDEVRPLMDDLALKYGDRMRYLGEIPYVEVVRRTQQAHLGLFLLRPDSHMWSEEHPVSPNKIYEYLLSGTIPVVRAALDDLDLIKPCALTFGKGSTFEEMRNSIAILINDRARMSELMIDCLELGRGFSWESVSQSYLEIYGRLFDSIKQATNQ